MRWSNRPNYFRPRSCPPADWIERVNEEIDERELNLLRLHIQRGRPLGSAAWIRDASRRMGLEWTMRDRGRLAKEKKEKSESQ